jgi:hypothetical protein
MRVHPHAAHGILYWMLCFRGCLVPVMATMGVDVMARVPVGGVAGAARAHGAAAVVIRVEAVERLVVSHSGPPR